MNEPAFCEEQIGWDALLAALKELGESIPIANPKFGYDAQARVSDLEIRGCYHVSQQNAFTGRLTEAMIDEVLREVVSSAQAES